MNEKFHILIVDDTLQNLELLEKLLTHEGYGVRAFQNGKKAILASELEPPDLILLDILVPDISGYEICIKLKKIPALENVPIIFISALSMEEDIVKGFHLGAVDYITKPIRNEEVLARVSTHLNLKAARNELHQMNLSLEKIVARKSLELYQSEERLKFALEASNEGIYDINFLTRKSYRSEKYLKMVNKNTNELPGFFKGIECVHVDDVDDVQQRFKYFINSGESKFELKYRIQQDDENILWCKNQFNIVQRDSERNVLRLVGTLSDITPQINYENEMRKLSLCDSTTNTLSEPLILSLIDYSIETLEKIALIYVRINSEKIDYFTTEYSQLLIEISNIIKRVVDKHSKVGKKNNKGFLILIPSYISKKVVLQIVDELSGKFNQNKLISDINSSLSIFVGAAFSDAIKSNLNSKILLDTAKKNMRSKFNNILQN